MIANWSNCVGGLFLSARFKTKQQFPTISQSVIIGIDHILTPLHFNTYDFQKVKK